MTMVEVEEEGREAVWVDGYMADASGLERARQEVLGNGISDMDSQEFLELADRKEIFHAIVEAYWFDHIDGMANTYPEFSKSLSDFFLLEFRKSYTALEQLPKDFPFYRDLLREEDNHNYVQLVFTSPAVYDHKKKIKVNQTKHIISRIPLLVKSDENYEDLYSFQKYCEWLLRKVITPYVAPCIHAERELYKTGFRMIDGLYQ